MAAAAMASTHRMLQRTERKVHSRGACATKESDPDMLKNLAQLLLLALVLVGCSVMRKVAAATTVRHRLARRAAQAAACFARNAEEHSPALVSEVHPPNSRGQIEVVVRVKNGIAYA